MYEPARQGCFAGFSALTTTASSSHLYGYRVGEIPLPKPGPMKANITAHCRASPRDVVSKPMMTSLGCHIPFVPPVCDTTDPKTALVGASKRFLCDTSHGKPPHDLRRANTHRLRCFVRKWLKKNLTPLGSSLEFEEWLSSTNYSQKRRDELLRTWSDRGQWSEKLLLKDQSVTKVKSFVKLEHYVDYKHARSINSRSDLFKCLTGPVFKSIEKEVFALPYFIKKVPVSERPDLIRSYVVEGEYGFSSDYTAFEAHFTRDLMRAVEFELYSYMTKRLPCHSWFMDACHNVLASVNHCSYRDFSIDVEATRMSGEMCTSLGNGFTNLMIVLFLSEQLKNPVRCFVEGDDLLAFWKHTNMPDSSHFAGLGFDVKIETHDNPTEASFCGMVFDLHNPSVVTDPRYVLASFAWTKGKYANSSVNVKKQLLRAKSLSVKAQYPGCPILEKLADYGLRVTSGITVSDKIIAGWDTYKKDTLLHALNREQQLRHSRPISPESRSLVEKLYGIPVSLQLRIEEDLDELQVLAPLDFAYLDIVMPDNWGHCYFNYTGDKNWTRPPVLFDTHVDMVKPLFRKLPWFLQQ